MYTFIESSIFEKICPVYLDDDEYGDLQQYMMLNPEAGEIVRGWVESENYAGRVLVWANAAAFG